MSADMHTVTTSTTITDSMDAIIRWVPSMFVHVETPAERYLRLSNMVADGVAWAMENGLEESAYHEGAEIADALALLSDVAARLAL